MVSFIIVTNLLVFLYVQTTDYASAELSGKITSICTPGGGCVTIMCIDDHPCETIVSNASNSTELGNLIENKTRVALLPRELV